MDDYKKLIELAIIFLGGVPERSVHCKDLDVLHRALLKAILKSLPILKAIYLVKIYLFRYQFKLPILK